jgi:hypothetical protein
VPGVVESFFKSKKYIVPSAIVSPVFAGCVGAVYVGTEAGRFDPARKALVYNADRSLEAPIGAEDRRSYELELNHLVAAEASKTTPTRVEKSLARLMSNAAPGFDSEGRPVLRMRVGEEAIDLGLAEGNIFAPASSGRFAQQLLEARLQEELRRGNPPKVSEDDVEHDWTLLQRAVNAPDNQLAARDARPLPGGSQLRWARAGNRP